MSACELWYNASRYFMGGEDSPRRVLCPWRAHRLASTLPAVAQATAVCFLRCECLRGREVGRPRDPSHRWGARCSSHGCPAVFRGLGQELGRATFSTQPLEAACRVTYDAAQRTTSVNPAWNPFTPGRPHHTGDRDQGATAYYAYAHAPMLSFTSSEIGAYHVDRSLKGSHNR